MKLLLDTSVVLWYAGDSPRLSPETKAMIAGPENQVFVSAISVWEIEIKTTLGKLSLDFTSEDLMRDGEFLALDFTFEHARAAGQLPRHHHDPFDRALVAQAMSENMVLLTPDRQLAPYSAVHVRVF